MDDHVDRLERLAQDLIVRVRDDDPEANAQWLASVSEEDRWALLFVLAAAVPDDRSWPELVAWADPDAERRRIERRRQQWREAQQRLSAKRAQRRRVDAA